jgi:hypothetical protein
MELAMWVAQAMDSTPAKNRSDRQRPVLDRLFPLQTVARSGELGAAREATEFRDRVRVG